MRKYSVRQRRVQIRSKRFASKAKPIVSGGSIGEKLPRLKRFGGQRGDLFRQEQMKDSLPKSELGQSNMDATIKRGMARKAKILGQALSKRSTAVEGGTIMDPLESVRLPKFVGGKKMNRNNIRISI